MKKIFKFLIALGVIAVSLVIAYVSSLIFTVTGLSDSAAPPIIVFIISFTVLNGIASKFVPDSVYFHFFYYPDWEKKSKVLVIFLVSLFVASTVLAVFRPAEAKMIDMASDEVRAEIAADETRTQKRVITTYQSLYCINYVSFQSTTGAFNEKYVGFCGTIIPANDGPAATAGSFVSYTYRMLGCRQSFLFGIKLTVVLTAAAVTTGLFLAVFLALGKISKLKIISKICSGYIFFFRGTPLLIQLFVVYLAIPNMIPGFSWRLAALKIMPSVGNEAVYYGAFIAAYIAFSLNSGAYCAEIVRAAIQSIDKGQHEAAKALGLTYGQTMSKIIIPQSLGRLVPPVANEFIMVLKDASLVFAISLQDITTITQTIATNEASFTVFIPALLLFLCITALFSMVFNKLERYFSKYN